MTLLTRIAQNAKSLTVQNLIEVLANNRDFTDYIIYLNTQKQLFEKGVNADGVKLSDIGGDYSPFTLDLHPEKVKDRITLFDTGDFYNSFRVFLSGGNLTISADTIKDTSDLVADWGAQILGLNQESLSLLRDKAIQIIIPYTRQQLLKR